MAEMTATLDPGAATETGATDADDDREEIGTDGKRRSGASYPYYPLAESLEFARNVRELGNEAREEDLLKHLKLSRSTKSWAYKLSSAREFGLLQKSGRKQEARVTLTELAKKLLLPGDDVETQAAMLEAFQNPSLYQALHRRYAGAPVPPVDRLKNVLERDYNLLDTVSEIAAKAFIESARFAGRVNSHNCLIIGGGQPSSAAPPTSSPAAAPEPRPDQQPQSQVAPGRVIVVPEKFAVYGYQLRKDMRVELALPMDLTMRDVDRLHKWLQTLPFEDE